MDLRKITLISFGYFDSSFLRTLAETARHEYMLPVEIREGRLDLADFFDPSRRQYNGTRLLKAVDNIYGSDSGKSIGLFSIDLFIPILTYIFGQALLNGRTGIASIYRLKNEIYGIEADNNLLLRRFTKEVIHELGHTFGLIHCHTPECVMQSSTYVEDIDQKHPSLCNICLTAITGVKC